MKIREIFESIFISVSDSEFVIKAKNYYNKGDQQGLINHINELQRKSKAINDKELDQHLADLKLEVVENFHDEDDIELLIDMIDEFLNRKQHLNAEAGGGGGGAGGGGAGGGGAGGGGAAGGTGGTGGATGGTSSGGDGGSADSGGTSDSGTTSSDSTSSDAPVSRGYAFLGSMVPGKKYKKKKKKKKGYDFGKGVY